MKLRIRRIVWIVLGGLVGCAQNQKPSVVTAAPTVEELPVLPHLEPMLPAVITVEGADRVPRAPLVPELKEPELTAAERSVLGLDLPEFKFLPYADRRPPVGSRIGTWLGGVDTFNFGAGFPITAHNPTRTVTGIAGWGGAATFTDPLRTSVAGRGPARVPPSYLGPAGRVIVETDTSASKISQRKPRIER